MLLATAIVATRVHYWPCWRTKRSLCQLTTDPDVHNGILLLFSGQRHVVAHGFLNSWVQKNILTFHRSQNNETTKSTFCFIFIPKLQIKINSFLGDKNKKQLKPYRNKITYDYKVRFLIETKILITYRYIIFLFEIKIKGFSLSSKIKIKWFHFITFMGKLVKFIIIYCMNVKCSSIILLYE